MLQHRSWPKHPGAEDRRFSCEHREGDRRDQQLTGERWSIRGCGELLHPTPTAKNSFSASHPLCTCWAPRPQPSEEGFLPALTLLLTPTRSQKDLISCCLLGFGNYPLGCEVLVMDGEVLLGQTVARCFSL